MRVVFSPNLLMNKNTLIQMQTTRVRASLLRNDRDLTLTLALMCDLDLINELQPHTKE